MTNSETPATPIAPNKPARLDRRLLFGAPVAAAAVLGVQSAVATSASAAPLADAWLLGGNAGVNGAGSNYLGPTNVAPLVFKTTPTAASAPVERMRIQPNGRVGIGTAAPAARLDVTGSNPRGIQGTTTANTAGAVGVSGSISSTTAPSNSAGVKGTNAAQGIGVWGACATGTGVYGAGQVGAVAEGQSLGCHGLARASDGIGLKATATDGTAVYATGNKGVFGDGHLFGLSGYARAAGGIGVDAVSERGPGVRGSTDVQSFGVQGIATLGTGVYGKGAVGAVAEGQSLGCHGLASATNGIAVQGTASATDGIGVQGTAAIGSDKYSYGVKGKGRVGVFGDGGNTGVRGDGGIYGGHFTSLSDVGVYAVGYRGGVMAENNHPSSGYAIRGIAHNQSSKAIWGASAHGFAGYFEGFVRINGDLHIAGTLSKSAGSFKIDHPVHPETKYLSHSFVESPDMMNVYNGNVTTDSKGRATVELPDYFGALNRDYRYQLTIIDDDDFAQARIASKVKNNKFTIATDRPGVEVSWQVTGIRQDAYANAHRIPVEEDKPKAERGT